MRGRIRQLKPELFLDEEFWALDEAHLELHLLRAFEGLWCQSDREGRFEWRPQMLKSQIMPYWNGDFSCVLEVLREAGYVQRYEVGGRYYGVVRTFHRHQRPNNREPESAIPAPLQGAEVSLEHPKAENARPLEPAGFSPARVPTPYSLLPTPDPDSQPRPAHASTDATPLHREPPADPAKPVETDASPRVIKRIPEDFVPSEGLLANVVNAGYSTERFLIRLAAYRLGPIGGTRGVFAHKLEEHLLGMAGQWKTWDANDAAATNARAGPKRTSSRDHHQPDAGVDPWAKVTIV